MNKITEFYTEWFSVCSNITSKFRAIATLESSLKQNNDQIQLVLELSQLIWFLYTGLYRFCTQRITVTLESDPKRCTVMHR
jgi:hypothetical protein